MIESMDYSPRHSLRVQTQRERKIKKAIFMGTMMAPGMIGFLIFYVYVNFNSIIMAFTVEEKLSIGNFQYFFNELKNPYSVFSEAIKNTAMFFVLGYVQMLLSLLVSYFIYKQVAGFAEKYLSGPCCLGLRETGIYRT